MGLGVLAGVARAISPDVCCGHPGLRSLGGNLASPSWLRSVSYAARLARATPPTPAILGRGFDWPWLRFERSPRRESGGPTWWRIPFSTPLADAAAFLNSAAGPKNGSCTDGLLASAGSASLGSTRSKTRVAGERFVNARYRVRPEFGPGTSCRLLWVVTWLLCGGSGRAVESSWVWRGDDGLLDYQVEADGDRIPDFSMVGFGAGWSDLPATPPVMITVAAAT